MYSTLADIKKLIPEETIIQLTFDGTEDPNANPPVVAAIDEAKVTEAIASADAEIDSYCASNYTVPFSPVPGIIKKLSVDITIYNLYSRKVEDIPETRAERYKNAIRQLEGIAKGLITLGDDEGAAEEGGVETNKTEDDRIFTKDKLGGY